MADYENGKNVLLKRPEPGRPLQPQKPKEVQKQIDTDAIANAVIAAITKKMPSIVVHESKEVQTKESDAFDDSSSMEKLAQAMIVQRGNSESNFNDLGKEKQTVKSKEEVDKTIDLLSKIGD